MRESMNVSLPRIEDYNSGDGSSLTKCVPMLLDIVDLIILHYSSYILWISCVSFRDNVQ